jgi:hypothetical protein
VKIALFLLTLLLPAAAFGAEPQPVPPGQMLQGRFVQERALAGIPRPLRSEGRFLLVPGTGLIWRAEKPFASVTVITPGGLTQAVSDQQTLNLPATRLPFLKPFYDMLSGALAGDWKAIEQNFTVTREDQGPNWGVRLLPKTADASMPFESIRLSGTTFVDSVEIAKSGGDQERLVFTDQTLAPASIPPEDARLFDSVGK